MKNLNGLKFPVLLFFWSVFAASIWSVLLLSDSVFILEFDLANISSVPFSFLLIVDKTSMSFSTVVTLIAGSVFTFAHKYMEEDEFADRFLWILMLFVISMNLLTFSGSLFFLLLGWDGLGITSFALIIYYQSFDSLSAGFQTLMVNRLGDAIIVVSTFLFVLLGQFTFFSLTEEFISVGLVFILCVAGLTKSAQYPFSSWLPAAMAAPTPVSALVHSSTLVTAGIFLMIRLSSSVPLSSSTASMLLLLGAVTCLLGGWAATYENDIKKIIALSTLSQLGVMVFCLGLGMPNLALFHLFTHALFKALLFLAAGNILMASFGTQDIRLLGGVGMVMPFTSIMFNVSSLCLVGAPFLSAFYSKHMILEKMFMSPINMSSLLLMLVATFMTAKYVSRTLKMISWGKPLSPITGFSSGFYSSFPVLVLSLGAIVGGKFIYLVDVYNYQVAFIPSIWGNMINLVTIFGIGLGVIQGVKKLKSVSLSTLFYLTPVVSMGTKMLSPLLKEMSNLDYGWLEPSFNFKSSISSSGAYLSTASFWPKTQSSFMGFLCFIFGAVYVCSSFS